jgi:hypothetical protein
VEQLGVILSALTAAKIQNWFVLDVRQLKIRSLPIVVE